MIMLITCRGMQNTCQQSVWLWAVETADNWSTYAFSKDFGSFANDFVLLAKASWTQKSNMDNYWSLMSAAYTRAMKHNWAISMQLATKDFENYHRATSMSFWNFHRSVCIIRIFWRIYGKLFGSQLNISRTILSIVKQNFRLIQPPNKARLTIY